MPNPYLPLWEYIPDGEPRVFGNRVYVYGSPAPRAGATLERAMTESGTTNSATMC